MINHPVQGSAATVFKAAGNRLYRLYPRYDAHLIVPMHDAFVFEAPIGRLQEVADLTERVMCDTLQEYFPELQPKAEPNISHPECWNKDGVVDALGVFIRKVDEMMGTLEVGSGQGSVAGVQPQVQKLSRILEVVT
jgi:DNA polymerase-1